MMFKTAAFTVLYFTAMLGAVVLVASCSSMAPDGKGSVDAKTGKERDPSEMLAVGTTAPDFKATDADGGAVALADFKGKKNVVLVFYPGDNTPMCTSQLCAVRDDWKAFESKEVVAFGINPAGVESKKSFASEYKVPFPLIPDVDGQLTRAYGCRGLAGIVTRTVYGIDKTGTIVFAERGKPNNDKILAAFKE